ncbi:MAG: GntR family transcriptional regulator [Gammaproteobacteria bacterium]|nr:GntR family transcriptional regulator [Gammaproteobacteria bacterium]
MVYSCFMVTLSINRESKKAVYEQVASQVRQLVASGALVPGASLPSVRQLAGDLGVNLNTIARAYRLLQAEGFLAIRDRAGVTVAAPAESIGDADKSDLLEQLRITLGQLRQAGISADDLLNAVRCEVEAMNSAAMENRND